MWNRGLQAQILLIVFTLIWAALLVRTSTKPWVRPVTPNWTRLTEPKFFLRQLGAAILIGVAAWLIVGPVAAMVCFVTSWLVIGLTVGFGQTLATDVQLKVTGPLASFAVSVRYPACRPLLRSPFLRLDSASRGEYDSASGPPSSTAWSWARLSHAPSGADTWP